MAHQLIYSWLILFLGSISAGDLPAAVSENSGMPDRDTTGLWLFDEFSYPHTTLTDASPYAKADLRLMEGGKMADGKYGRALRVGGAGFSVSYAGFAGKVPEEEMREPDGDPSGLWGPTEGPEALLQGLSGRTWTIEFWLNRSPSKSKIIILDIGRAYDPGMSLRFNGRAFELDDYYAGVKAACPLDLPAGEWHHFAFSRDGSNLRFFLDGRRVGVWGVESIPLQPMPDLEKPADREHESRGFEYLDFEERRQRRFNFSIGSDRHGKPSATFLIDELRISRIARYAGPFAPKSFSRNFGPNAPAPATANGPPLLFDPGPVSIPLNFGARKYVFLDDAIIDSSENVRLSMNRPYGKELIGKDFEIEKTSWRPSVFEVDGVVFMAIPESYSSNEGLTFLATSKDGLNFFMKGTIIPETPLYGAFFKDLNPAAPIRERYKLNAFVGNRGMYIYTSPDGLNWSRNETIQLPLRSGGGGECYWDDQLGRYASYIKRDSSACTEAYPCKAPHGHRATVFYTREIMKPWPFKALPKPYFEGWPFPVVTGEGPVGFYATDYGFVYRTRAIKYPWAPDAYLAFIWRYPGDDLARHVELSVSRNGVDWKFFGTNWYFPTGAAEEELSLYGLIRRRDEIWQYADEGGAHGGDAPRQYYRYRQRLDGFVSLDAGEEEGVATTLPLRFEGDKLVLNIKAAGSAKVALSDAVGKELPGFGLADSDPITSNAVALTATWRGKGDLTSLRGKTIRVKFQMRNAKLYSFAFRH